MSHTSSGRSVSGCQTDPADLPQGNWFGLALVSIAVKNMVANKGVEFFGIFSPHTAVEQNAYKLTCYWGGTITLTSTCRFLAYAILLL